VNQCSLAPPAQIAGGETDKARIARMMQARFITAIWPIGMTV
jgi:hypothetical protein